jgi:hypothetical protein
MVMINDFRCRHLCAFNNVQAADISARCELHAAAKLKNTRCHCSFRQHFHATAAQCISRESHWVLEVQQIIKSQLCVEFGGEQDGATHCVHRAPQVRGESNTTSKPDSVTAKQWVLRGVIR